MEKTISIRATELEAFYKCAFKHKYQVREFSDSDALLFWNYTHSVLNAYAIKPENWISTLEFMCMNYTERCDVIFKYLWLYDINELQKKYNVVSTEYKNIITHRIWDYKLVIEWTIDCVSKDIWWDFTLLDWKTSKAEWKDDDYEYHIQKYIYSRMFAKLVWQERVKWFDYIIFTKHVTPRFQLLHYEADFNYINKFMDDLLNAYVESTEKDLWNPSVSKQCFYCSLKNNCPTQKKWTDDFNF